MAVDLGNPGMYWSVFPLTADLAGDSALVSDDGSSVSYSGKTKKGNI